MTLPDWLATALKNHRDTYAPVWRGFLSDHLPMTAMALWHQGNSRPAIEAWMQTYQSQLVRLDSADDSTFEEAMGNPDKYAFLLRYFDEEIARRGVNQTLQAYLPKLVSGWVADAFHPLIRLGYGRRFDFAPEISAGLAYMAIKGPESSLLEISDDAIAGEITWPVSQPLEGRTFDERARYYLRTSKPNVRIPDEPLLAYARASLDVLNATHNFFALHLVTATHAFMFATQGVEGISPAILATGLIAGYVTAGAPPFEPGVAPTVFHTDFEHDIKLAFAVQDLAERTGDEGFAAAARVYSSELPAVDGA
ncbi:MAG: DUF4243 domain-containing protein [Pseudomonadales bacterium]|nr:DUF4243 domain-containing protein [Pseudomonadales bacterium]